MAQPVFKIRIDSDMLRNLALFCKYTKDGNYLKNIDYRKISDDHIKQYFDDYLFIMDKVKSGKLEIYVSRYVIREIEHIDYVMEFKSKFCHTKIIDNNDKIEDLANAYCSPYIENGEKLLPPMDKQYVAAINKVVPTNDCYIMAEATVNFSFLLTNNLQHFIYDKSSPDPQDHRRIDGIRAINVKKGYSRKGKNGDFIPQPMILPKLVRFLRKHLEKEDETLIQKRLKQNNTNKSFNSSKTVSSNNFNNTNNQNNIANNNI